MNLANWPKRLRLPFIMILLMSVLGLVAIAKMHFYKDEYIANPVSGKNMLIAKAPTSPGEGGGGMSQNLHWGKVREIVPAYDGMLPAGSYWLKMTLNGGNWNPAPSLYLYNIVYFRLYLDNKELYRFDADTHPAYVNGSYNWHLIPINQASRGKELMIWMTSDGRDLFLPSVIVEQPEHLYQTLFKLEISNYLLAALFFFCGTAAAFFYILRRERAHLYLMFFTIAAGYSSFVRNHSFQLLIDNTWYAYLHDISLPFCVYAFVGILEHLFPELYPRTHRWLRWLLLAFSALCALSSLTSPHWYYALFYTFFPPLFFVSFAVVTHTIYRAYRRYDGVETSWVMAGFALVTLNALIHLLGTTFASVYFFLIKWFPPLLYWDHSLLFWSIFLLMLCFIRVIYARYETVNQQLEIFNRSLEEMVSQRTLELNKAHIQLTDSLRDSSEAMAATLVMEERQRIAYTIHDTVGHTLTASIVQMEAAKRLLEKDADLARSKFDASQQLVRKGLDEIRGSVRLLQEDPADYNLSAAIEGLIFQTIAATGVEIISHFDELPEILTILQKRVLYHALQEGLTNGIRHGGCSQFTFNLAADDRALTFRLSNNGAPYSKAEFGFGLKAMEERVRQLGGLLKIEPDGTGTVLSLVLPLRQG
ncbi:histidine kinase [Paenibacillus solisilvae]|uniref:histidine kinase n=1 Tax=Paenibacillus solisilvae TaxID=2486751 RepID=A0ABW0W327_9BACL